MAKQPFRSIGQRLRTIARTHISTYIPTGNMVSRVELPPSWQKNADEPLVWREDPLPAPVQEATPEPVEVEESQPSGGVTHGMLQRLMEAHEERIAREEAAKAEAAEAASTLQRQTDSNDADGQPRSATRRRRGAVIDVPAQPSAAPTDEETPPDFFFLNDPAPEDVQRAQEPEQQPAPQPHREPPSSSSGSETSFWRGLFSRRGDAPDISTERADDNDAFTNPADEYEDTPQDSPVEPLSSGAAQVSDTPSIQRKPEATSRRRATQPDVQRETSQPPTYASAETPAPAAYEADLPAGVQIAPSTPTAPHSIQRQTGEMAAHVTSPVQRRAAQEDFIVQPDHAAKESTFSTPDSPPTTRQSASPSSVQRTVASASQAVTGQPAPDVQRESRQPSSSTFSPAPAGNANDVPDVVTPTSTPSSPATVQRQTDAPSTSQSSTQISAGEPTSPATSSVSTPEQRTSQSTIQRRAEPDFSSAAEEEEIPSGTPDLTDAQAKTEQPSATSTPSVQRSVRPSNQISSQSAPAEPARRPQIDSSDQPAPVQTQRSAEIPEPAAGGESHPTSEWQGALTTLSPASEPASSTKIRRKAKTQPEPVSVEADAPTIITPAAPPPSDSEAPDVQRQTTAEPVPDVPRESRLPGLPPSPWTEFMHPAERKTERIKRPTPPPVQRAPESSGTSEPADALRTPAVPSDTLYRATDNDMPSLAEQPVDLFTALMDAGMVTSAPAEGAPPQISQRAAPESQAPVQNEFAGTGLEQHVPHADSVEADLLSLIDMPPNTPVIRQAQSEPTAGGSIARASEQNVSEPPAFRPPTIEEHGEALDSQILARATSTPSASGGEAKTKEEGGVDVDKLARDVLGVLRRRLRTEQERRGGKL